ncbi:MAG: hypothetical protein KF708_24955 [Pirellulales bacterium]|nr:hypothetical protein [Pirellulales bacterium]
MCAAEHDPLELNEDEQRIYELLGKVSDQELRRMAKLLAGKGDSELFGQTEFELRDRVHALGARALEAVADERQKKGRIRRS